jgi:ribosomal protein S18 acetylase RimI-like enzyme
MVRESGELDGHDAAVMVEVAPMDPADPDAQRCLRAYIAELNSRFETGFDPSRSISAAEEELRPPAGLFLLASLQGVAIGCGALKFHGGEPTEIKRMWVSASVRGLGVGRRLLTELEIHAARHGATVLRLETNATLTEAIGLYRSAGYVEVAAFNDEPYAQHWFEKQLG